MKRLSLHIVSAMAIGAASLAGAAPAAIEQGQWPFSATPRASFSEPWAMTFLPDGTALVTEKRGALKRVDVKTGKVQAIDGVPEVAYGGQGGFGDVILHPDFAQNNIIYLSYAEPGDGDNRGAAVARAKLELGAEGGSLSDTQVIWQQTPKVSGKGHYGHRLAFGPDGKLWISSGERQKFKPAQDMESTMGKILRLNADGSVPDDNPFADKGGVTAQIWSLGHRNPLGIAFDDQGRLWEHEMGPQGGDEFNLIQKAGNYGYPEVSNGDHYGGRPIPDHDTRPEFIAPKISWTPVISPAGMIIYDGDRFADWKGDAFIGGLSAEALVRVTLNGEAASEAARYNMGARIREVEQGPDGSIWLLEDGDGGRLLELSPK
ncbi:PQQ-dependent sugar dehydrogenase [Stutzerimonas xanthomarina]|uniref:PQQ-dependent sugar dehydrogenase n=1 Tax=Stutzerimonas xanthomarina TaxID=271420 RepID=UPI003AA8A12C